MAHTKQLGSTKLGRESESKRLGVKRQHGQVVHAGEVIIRQRGIRYVPGENMRRGADDTLYSKIAGVVSFKEVKKTGFDGRSRYATKVSIKPLAS